MSLKKLMIYRDTMRGQVSLEYLLIFAGFCSALLIIIPTINFVTNNLFITNDTLLAKNISETIFEQEALFSFLENGSRKEFVFSPVKEINVSIVNNEIKISTLQKEFVVNTKDSQEFSNNIFNSKFYLIVEKKQNKTTFTFN